MILPTRLRAAAVHHIKKQEEATGKAPGYNLGSAP